MDAPPRLSQPAKARQRGRVGRDRDSMRGAKHPRTISFGRLETTERPRPPVRVRYLASSSFETGPLSGSDPRT
jgi:hypothetical protein